VLKGCLVRKLNYIYIYSVGLRVTSCRCTHVTCVTKCSSLSHTWDSTFSSTQTSNRSNVSSVRTPPTPEVRPTVLCSFTVNFYLI